MAKSDDEFDAAKLLWLKKYENCTNDVNDFVGYFRDDYLTKHVDWHEGVELFSPSTNNGLESTNNVIKSH